MPFRIQLISVESRTACSYKSTNANATTSADQSTNDRTGSGTDQNI